MWQGEISLKELLLRHLGEEGDFFPVSPVQGTEEEEGKDKEGLTIL